MSDNVADGIFNITQPVVMYFPQLFEPKKVMKNGKETGESKYSASFMFEPDSEELKAMKQLAAKLARAKWPDKPFVLTTQEGVKLPQVLFPFATGEKINEERAKKSKKPIEFIPGKVVISARSKFQPQLGYVEKSGIVNLETDAAKLAAKAKFYPGVKCCAQLNFFAYDAVGDGLPGVSCYLNAVLSTGQGKRLSGGQSTSEIFKGYAGALSAEDPTAPGAGEALDDEIPY